MIYPIVLIGDPVLKKKTEDIPLDMPDLKETIENMFETMHNAHGVGLAAPQVGKSLRLFVIDASAWDDEPDLVTFKKVFINAEIVSQTGTEWKFEEGCLSIPGMKENVVRKPTLTIKYLDENLQPQEETFDGLKARIIQHEYDHIDGILYTDRLPAFKKAIIKSKLNDISRGIVDVKYPIRVWSKR